MDPRIKSLRFQHDDEWRRSQQSPYTYFDSWEFTNVRGGISNGINSGFHDQSDVGYLVPYRQTGADNDCRWGEQWLPHAAWYFLASIGGGGRPHIGGVAHVKPNEQRLV